jgi:phosphoglycerate dehydrogenase-like enzyme
LTPHIAGSTVNSEETTARNLAARVKAAISASATISE